MQRSPSSLQTSDAWYAEFIDIGLPSPRARILADYAGHLAGNGLPAIFSFRHLCLLLGKQPMYVASIIFGTEAHYRTFLIPKRSGGHRQICAPYPALLECQQWIARNILACRPVSDSAHGYVIGRSILTNAKRHAGRPCMLKMDIKDFFPSTPISRVIGVFKELGYSSEIAFFLAKICTLSDSLPQGAATSPALSNLIFNQLDKRIHGLARRNKLHYTRYADDLVFSGKSISNSFASCVSEILKEYNFTPNPDKLIYLSGNRRKIVTGIDATKRELRLPRAYRRIVRQQAHLAITLGPVEYIARQRRGPVVLRELLGKLQYWITVEPKNAYALDAHRMVESMCNTFLA